jgi:hypothetical protein
MILKNEVKFLDFGRITRRRFVTGNNPELECGMSPLRHLSLLTSKAFQFIIISARNPHDFTQVSSFSLLVVTSKALQLSINTTLYLHKP